MEWMLFKKLFDADERGSKRMKAKRRDLFAELSLTREGCKKIREIRVETLSCSTKCSG
jgi:hypothetical protein